MSTDINWEAVPTTPCEIDYVPVEYNEFLWSINTQPWQLTAPWQFISMGTDIIWVDAEV